MPPIDRLRQALAIVILCLPALAVGAAPFRGSKVFLDEMKRLDWAAPHPTTVYIVDSSPPAVWKRCLNPGDRGKSRTNAVGVFRGRGDGDPACRIEGELPKACLDQLGDRSRTSELTLVVKDRRLDSAVEMTMGMGPASVPSAYLHYKPSADVFLVETGSARLLYHARLSGSAATLEGAEAGLCKEVSERLANVFDPDLGRDFPRHRVDANPIGILIASNGGVFLQGGYERLLGDGRVALFWAPGYLDHVNDEWEFQYLYLPIIGMRYYLRREGQGWWFGGKLGYARIYEAQYEETYEANLAFLMAEIGWIWSFKSLHIRAHLDLGPGMGWIEEGWREFGWYYNPPPEDLESGFGIRPVFEAGLGIGYAF